MTHEECLDDLQRIKTSSKVLMDVIEVLSIAKELAVTEYEDGDPVMPQRTLVRLSLLVDMSMAYLDCERDELHVISKRLIEEFENLNLTDSRTLKGKASCQTVK